MRRRSNLFLVLTIVSLSSYSQDKLRPAKARIDVSSVPSGSEVFVDSVFLGFTPLVIDTISPLRPFKVMLMYEEFEPWSTTFILRAGEVLKISPVLRATFGTLNLTTDDSDSEIFLDGFRVAVGKLDDIRVPEGEHVIEVHQKELSRVLRKKVAVKPGTVVRATTNYDYFTAAHLGLGLIVPGLGQATDGHYLEGILFAGGVIVSAYYFIHWSRVYNNLVLKYDSYRDGSANIQSIPEASQRGHLLRLSYHEAQLMFRKRLAAGSTGFLVYGLSVLEALAFHTAGSSIDVLSTRKDPLLMPKVSLYDGAVLARFEFVF